MESGQLLLASLEDLRRLVDLGDDYSMLRASGLLRQLVLDRSALVHTVNRGPHLKLRFTVCGRAYTKAVLEDRPVFYSALGGVHTSGPMARSCEMLPLDGLLATVVLKLGDQILTIRDVVDIAANILGGVHKDEPNTAKAKAISDFSRVVSVGGQSITAAQLKPIALVVLDGLAPLEALIARDSRTGPAA